MSVFVLLIPVSLVLSTLFVWACIASIRSGQFDDLESPRWRMLFPEKTGQAALEQDSPIARVTGMQPPSAKVIHDHD